MKLTLFQPGGVPLRAVDTPQLAQAIQRVRGGGVAALIGHRQRMMAVARQVAETLGKRLVTAPRYIGETEKNLAETVRAAARRNAVILFLDESEALLGGRADVREAHDRYANQETSYLLKSARLYRTPILIATRQRPRLIPSVDC